MCRVVSVELHPVPRAAALAREALQVTCSSWGLEDLADDLTLMASELVTNAVLHAHTPVRLELTVAAGVVELSVADRAPQQPTVRPVRDDLLADLDTVPQAAMDRSAGDSRHPDLHVGMAGSIAAGRGLLLIEGLADRWGVVPTAEGKAVWAALPSPPTWPWSQVCRCGQGTRRTAAGAPVLHLPGAWDELRATAP